ncbi:MAG: alpha/beta hydrolase [Paludibacter sp.]
MTNYFIIPGYGGSGENHWQTWLEKSGENFQRVIQKDWNNPNIDDWTSTLDKTLAEYEHESVVLIAHSLGCLMVAEWAGRYNRNIKAALLVAPPDTDQLHGKLQKKLFAEVPLSKLNFPTKLVASTNDPWATIKKAKFYAQHWGSEFINIGQAGHINDLSGHYEWQQGLELLYSLD